MEGLGRGELKQNKRSGLCFRPGTQTPLLVVTNRHPTSAAHFGAIRVLKCSSASLDDVRSSPRMSEWWQLTCRTRSRPMYSPRRRRPKPQNPARCKASTTGKPRSNRRLRISTCGSLVITAPSSVRWPMAARFSPIRQCDSRHATTPGRLIDRLSEVDKLDMTLSVFDRDRLTLIPAVEFATPLPQLEALRHAEDPRATGLVPVGPDGRTWLESYGNRSGLVPYYNVLDERVQNAIIDVAQDLVRRYGGHSAFGGLALQLTSDGFAASAHPIGRSMTPRSTASRRPPVFRSPRQGRPDSGQAEIQVDRTPRLWRVIGGHRSYRAFTPG